MCVCEACEPYPMPYVTIHGVDSGRDIRELCHHFEWEIQCKCTVNGALSTMGQFMSSFHMNASTDYIPLGIHKVSTRPTAH